MNINAAADDDDDYEKLLFLWHSYSANRDMVISHTKTRQIREVAS